MRHIFLMFAPLALIGVLAGCKAWPGATVENCVERDDLRPWRLLEEPPPSADTMRHLADESEQTPDGESASIERWISLPTGEIRLCRSSDRSPGLSGGWWEFSAGATPVLVESGGWDIVVVG